MANRQNQKETKILSLLLLAMASRWKGRRVLDMAWAAPQDSELLTSACRGRLHISFNRWVYRDVQAAERKS